MIRWSAEWKNGIVFFAVCTQQRAKLALVFSVGSLRVQWSIVILMKFLFQTLIESP